MKTLTCIVCPKGCRLTAEEEGEIRISGAGCPRGIAYGKKEVTAPTRVLTSTVRVTGAAYPRLPVKTRADIPKALIPKAMAMLKDVCISAPVKVGDVIMENICGTGIPWIATRTLNEKETDTK